MQGGGEARGGEATRVKTRALAVDAQHRIEVGLVRGELVDALEVMVAADDLVRHVEGREELGGQLVARCGAREEFVRLVGAHLVWGVGLGLELGLGLGWRSG